MAAGDYMPKAVQAVVRDPRRSGAPICTAHRADGRPCGYIAVGGTTKCQRHGGKSLRGMASPAVKHGRYSRSLPTQLRARYEEARANPRLLSLTDEIALQQAHLAELLTQVDTGESGAAWQAVKQHFDAFSGAQARGDMDGMQTAWDALRQVITQGGAAVSLWEEIHKTCDTLRTLVQAETKTLLGLQQLITVQQHMLMLGAVTEAVVQAVQAHADATSGRKILMAVEAEFTRLATLEEK
jgi:hypothetical protein